MIWIRVLMLVLIVYYGMLIFQVITGVTWTSKEVTPLRFICPFYFWFTLRPHKDGTEIGIDTETKGFDDPFKNSEDDINVFVKDKGEWVPEKEFHKRTKRSIK